MARDNLLGKPSWEWMRCFTDLNEAKRFAAETGCDWLSVAVGSIHGAIADGVRNQKKPEARLDIQHIADLSKITGIPLVLHGGSGINNQCILDGTSSKESMIFTTKIAHATDAVLTP